MNVKIKYLGINLTDEKKSTDLITAIIKKIASESAGNESVVVSIVYPYVCNSIYFKLRWAINAIDTKLKTNFIKDKFRFLINVKNSEKVLFISHENLERSYWWKNLGEFLVDSDISRLTFWPTSVDPKGERFPYWYNYVDWEGYPRENPSSRYSEFLEVDKLMKPLLKDDARKNIGVYIGSHMDFPRLNLCKRVEQSFTVKKYGQAYAKAVEDKFRAIEKYKYSFCPENSSGLGYDTEKIPEAWNAGCIPIGCYINPYSDFNYALLNADGEVDIKLCYKYPLLLKEPTLENIEKYLKGFVMG